VPIIYFSYMSLFNIKFKIIQTILNDYLFYNLGSKCQYDNLTIYDKIGTFDELSKHVIGTYCGDNTPNSFTFMNSVMLIFMSDNSVGKKGFEIHYEFQGN